MTALGRQQRGLLALLKHRPFDASGDQWLESVANSPALVMMQEIAVWWRCYQISAQCRFSSRLLKQRGEFEETVSRFFDGQPTSVFIEQLGREFLMSLADSNDPVVRAVAATELGLRSLQGEMVTTEVQWDRDPNAVFAALDRFEAVPAADAVYVYTLNVGEPMTCVRRARPIPSS